MSIEKQLIRARRFVRLPPLTITSKHSLGAASWRNFFLSINDAGQLPVVTPVIPSAVAQVVGRTSRAIRGLMPVLLLASGRHTSRKSGVS